MVTRAQIEATAAALQRIEGLTVLTDEPMAAHTSFGIGGPAELFVIPTDIPSLSETIRVLHDFGIQLVILGNGTNVLVRDGGVRGAVIKLGGALTELREEGEFVVAGAGASLATLCRYCADKGWGGLLFAAGIPGSVGGAVLMNAGANGGEMADVVAWVVAVNALGEVERLTADQLGFGYRSTELPVPGCAIAEVAFQLTAAEGTEVHRCLCEAIQRRCEKQPVAQRSAGSIFKRPSNDYAGRLLDQAGAKGMRVGDAIISDKHANFIVNEGNATARDVLELIELVRAKVEERFGVRLDTEIVIIGED